jgi:hypothetical protein
MPMTDTVPVFGNPSIEPTEAAIDAAKLAAFALSPFEMASGLELPLIVASTLTEPALNATAKLLAATPTFTAILAATCCLIFNFTASLAAA